MFLQILTKERIRKDLLSMRKPKILVAPLDWGFGHAARCIPIVNELVNQGWEVSLAGSGNTLDVLHHQFPQLPVFPLYGYNIFYHTTTGNLSFTIVRQVPKIYAAIQRERRWLKRMIAKHAFDVVLSDNRYGLHSCKAYCIFITHQLHIRSGFGKWVDRIVQVINYRYIQKFNECWVPDYRGDVNLAGALSHPHKIPINAHYIGPVSRFDKRSEEKKYDVIIVLSGPEPCRTEWEHTLRTQLEHFEGNVLLVRGAANKAEFKQKEHLQVANILQADELNTAIEQSEWVICRSGYTSVMDLIKLGKKAILVPTPRQPEQEYLAEYLLQCEIFYTVKESEFSLSTNLAKAKNFTFRHNRFTEGTVQYKKHVTRLTEAIHKKLGSEAL